MVRLAVYSQDLKLCPLFGPAFGGDFEVFVESDATKIKELVSQAQCEVLMLDLDTRYSDIEEQVRLYEELSQSRIGVIVMTDDVARPTAVELVQRGALSYCRKPPVLRELKATVRRAYEHVVTQRELEAARTRLQESMSCDKLIGASAPMRVVYDLIRRVANLNASVLITGESGTGKELVARAIHNLGTRAKLPFVAVSCGAIPETLIEAELFGHEKGAFTGSNGMRQGYLEQAGNGTLFLDEIGELSQHTQVKLLRVLQQRQFSRLGSNRLIPLDARVIFATHKDLARMVAEHTFRLDLYYRVNVMKINCPSLADRPEDIPFLAQHFLERYSELYNKAVTSISPSALTLLQDYSWPGNIRELENVIQGAIILTEDGSIDPEDLPEPLQQQDALLEVETAPSGNFDRLLRDYKVKLASKAIQDCNGNKTLAARSLNISRAYLHRLIRLGEDEDVSVN